MTVPFDEIEHHDGLPIAGAAWGLRKPLEFWSSLERLDEPLVATHLFGNRFVGVFDPDLVDAVFNHPGDSFDRGFDFGFSSEGSSDDAFSPTGEEEVWQDHRVQVQRLFSPGSIEDWLPRIRSATNSVLAQYHGAGVVDFYPVARELSLDVSMHTIFGRPDLPRQQRERITESLDGFAARWRSPLNLALPTNVPTPTNRRFRRSKETLEAVVESELFTDEVHPDSVPGRFRERVDLSDPAKRRRVTADVLGFLLAGHDTLAAVIAFGTHLIAGSPDVQERLSRDNERIESLPTTYDNVQSLSYTRNVVDEVLRLYPGAPGAPRGTTEAVEIGGYEIPADTSIFVPIWAIHRSSKHYRDPEAFRPSRWEEPECPPHEYAFIPFGGGERHCKGERFARAALTVILPLIAAELSLEQVDPDPDVGGSVSIYPTSGLPIDLGG